MTNMQDRDEGYFGQDLIDAYANGRITTAEFARNYSMRYGTDETDASAEALETPIENDLFSLCVQFEDPMEDMNQTEQELRELVMSMARRRTG